MERVDYCDTPADERGAYYINFGRMVRRDAVEDPEDCACRGSGWVLSQVDTWHKCPVASHAGPHPEDDCGVCDA